MKEVSTDKIIAVGLIIACNIYAASSILLSSPPSGELLGTLFGGIIGALGRWAPSTPKSEENAANQNQHPPDMEEAGLKLTPPEPSEDGSLMDRVIGENGVLDKIIGGGKKK